MPKDDQKIDLENLKVDPRMWMRLAMPLDDGNVMGNVFHGKENPFEKDGAAAMERVQKLASEGKLYVRDFGRSRHFHKAELDGDSLKLGEQHEMKLSNRNTDPVLGLLMRASRAYFKWIGLDRVADWFDKRVQQRDAIAELDNQYKSEYQSFSADEKKALNALRKQEKQEAKARTKLEKLEKEVAATRQELDNIRGPHTARDKGEMDAPLSQPPKIESEKNTMQPTRLGDQPVQEQKPPQRREELTQERNVTQEIVAEEKEKTEEKKQPGQIILNGVEYTKENMGELPEIVQAALKVFQEYIAQQKATEQKAPQAEEKANEQQAQEPNEPNATEQKEGILIDLDDFTQPIAENQNVQPVDLETLQEIFRNAEPQPEIREEPKQADMPAAEAEKAVEQKEGTLIDLDEFTQPAAENQNVQPIDLETLQEIFRDAAPQPEIREEPKQADMPAPQQQPTLGERLAAEKQAMDSVANWKEHVANALFSQDNDGVVSEYYETIKDTKAGEEFLTGVTCGILANKTATPESKQQAIEALLDGKALDSQHEELINSGVLAYNQAVEQMKNGNTKPMEELVVDGAMELARQASKQDGLSSRHTMMKETLGKAMKMADEHHLNLNLGEQQRGAIRGAVELASLAQAQHNARQLLGEGPVDMSNTAHRNAARDLIMGAAVENMLRMDQPDGNAIANTQLLMGDGVWSVSNLKKMMGASQVRKEITAEQVQSIMENPNGFEANQIANTFGEEFVEICQETFAIQQKTLQKEHAQELEQPLVNPMQM